SSALSARRARSSLAAAGERMKRSGGAPYRTASASARRPSLGDPVSDTVHQARETLGHRLRDLRKDAGLSGRVLAVLAGWQSSKISKIEYGKQTPTENDIEVWCRHCDALEQVPYLVATVRNIETMYIDWRL